MTERPLFFKNGACSLFGVLHEPGDTGKGPAFVLCSPFAEEKLWAHRVFVNFARELSGRGHTVLRFDYMGNGDSDGDFEDTTAETYISDIKAAADFTLNSAGEKEGLCLLGLGLGGTFAALAAEELSATTGLILWNPVVNGAAYMQETLKINLTTQMSVYKEIRQTRAELVRMMSVGETVNVDGYEMSNALYEQVSAINLAGEKKRFSGRTLVVEISRKEKEPGKETVQLASAYDNATVSNVVEEPFWKEIKTYYARAENLFRVTLAWLER
ncbi:MAG: alpha/beta hydrolase [Candidatus Methylomirabilis sp.]|nr:alpha/beta hydrolase [Deltaproteobacteria bacterium]